MAILFFQNKQFVTVKKRLEFVVTVKNDFFFLTKLHKIYNFKNSGKLF